MIFIFAIKAKIKTAIKKEEMSGLLLLAINLRVTTMVIQFQFHAPKVSDRWP